MFFDFFQKVAVSISYSKNDCFQSIFITSDVGTNSTDALKQRQALFVLNLF